MRKLALIPSQAGYSVGQGSGTLTAALAGGPSRTRLDFVGSVSQVTCTWNLPPISFAYLEAFWRTASKEGSEPFLIDIVLDEWYPSEYQAKFIAGSFRIDGVSGMETTVSADLEVRPNIPDEDFDEALMDVFEEYGEEGLSTLLAFEHLVLEVLPTV